MQNACTRNGFSIEENYILSNGSVFYRENYVILSGCSGGGKSTLLNALCQKGYSCIPEPGRQIVKEQMSIGGDGLPWENVEKLMDLILSRCLHNFHSQKPTQEYIFFDRAIPDAIYAPRGKTLPNYQMNAAKMFRYNTKVFMTPPWKKIYRNDEERRHSFEQALAAYEPLLKTYAKYGYNVIEVPKISVEERAEFILSHLAL